MPIDGKLSVLPFAIGDLDPDRGFVHVFDDIGLEVVMTELDTIADFVKYLIEREKFIRSGRLLIASGEEDLLANYIQEYDGYSFQNFYVPDETETKVVIPEGEWASLQSDPAWINRKQADQVSYTWDRIIERFNLGILDGTSAAYPLADLHIQELAVRALASEPRFHRRILSSTLRDFLDNKATKAILARVVKPIRAGSPYYIFLAVRPETEEQYNEYRERRISIAYAYLIEGKLKFEANEIVVIATETPGWTKWSTEDVLWRGDDPLTDEEIASVRQYVEDQSVLRKLGQAFGRNVLEYPRVVSKPLPINRSIGNSVRVGRNERCPCGSGLKFKKCCLDRY